MPVIGASYYYQMDKSPDKKTLPAKGNVKFWDYGLLASPYIINYKTSSPSKESFIPKGSSLVFKSSNDQSYFYNITKTNLGLTGSAYRVTIPCVIHVAYMRQKLLNKDRF